MPPAYLIAEIDVKDPDTYARYREAAPAAAALVAPSTSTTATPASTFVFSSLEFVLHECESELRACLKCTDGAGRHPTPRELKRTLPIDDRK